MLRSFWIARPAIAAAALTTVATLTITSAATASARTAPTAQTVPAAASHGIQAGKPAAAARAAVVAGDRPAGFWYGTDSRTITISGSAPYREPVIGGSYGGYVGMTGNWANLTGCHKIVVWSAANSAQANTNFTTYRRASAPVCITSWAARASTPLQRHRRRSLCLGRTAGGTCPVGHR